MKYVAFALSASVLSASLLSGAAAAQSTITFETRPDGTPPMDDELLPLDAVYMIDGVGVTLGLDTDLDGVTETEAVFEIIGNDAIDGFRGQPGGIDTADPGFEDQLGTWFLRSPGDFSTSGDPGIFIIQYSQPVMGVSGEIWDIDSTGAGTEAWLVRAFDDSGNLLRTVRSPEPLPNSSGSLDGQPWIFSIADAAGISRVELDFDGTKTTNIGLAFNNYRATATLGGPRLLTATPTIVSTETDGVLRATTYWDEPVRLTDDDVTIVDASGDPVEFAISNNATNAVTITFRSEPAGPRRSNAIPLVGGQYTISIADTATAVDNNAPIDGDGDGISGGSLSFTVAHSCPADQNQDGEVNGLDFGAWLGNFNAGCP